MSPIPANTPAVPTEIRSAVQFEVGAKNMRDFEMWAFKRSPVTYNEEIPFLFMLSRSTKLTLPEGHVEAVAVIIDLWKKRHDWKHGGT